MKNPIYAICVIVPTSVVLLFMTLLTSCGEDAPPLSCGEWTPECEMQKDYFCFRVSEEPDTTGGLVATDALGFPLNFGGIYMVSTRHKAPVPIMSNDYFQILVSSGRAQMKPCLLPMEYGNAGTATKVTVYLTGSDELRPATEFRTGVAIKGHEKLSEQH